jgi:hypothetical protein
VLNARMAGSALSGACWSKDDQAYGRVEEEEERCGGRDDVRLPWLLLLLLLLALKNRLGMMGRSGWEARRMVDRGEEAEQTDDGVRRAELDREGAYSETDGSGGTLAAVDPDVPVDLSELRDAVGPCGHGRGLPPAGGCPERARGTASRPRTAAGPRPDARRRADCGARREAVLALAPERSLR